MHLPTADPSMIDKAQVRLTSATRRWRRRRKLLTLAGAAAAGAAATYFLDPAAGPERRASARLLCDGFREPQRGVSGWQPQQEQQPTPHATFG